jgi:hypothetical protein
MTESAVDGYRIGLQHGRTAISSPFFTLTLTTSAMVIRCTWPLVHQAANWFTFRERVIAYTSVTSATRTETRGTARPMFRIVLNWTDHGDAESGRLTFDRANDRDEVMRALRDHGVAGVEPIGRSFTK